MNLKDFFEIYPTDERCLYKLFSLKYGFKPYCSFCKKRRSFKKLVGRPVYQCGGGHQISPLAGTIFENSSTHLQLWFYAIFIMTVTRSGISAKALQRELKVTYKTAWRMMKQIRSVMGKEEGGLLEGIIEVDESYFGGKGVNRAYEWHQGKKKKQVLMGIVQRQGGASIKHISHAGKKILMKGIKDRVSPRSHIMTDDSPMYNDLYQYGYFNHHTVDHSAKEYVRKQLFHTNSVEGLWGRIKPAVRGVYRNVSPKYLESYMDEYCFRYNNRKNPDEMFEMILKQV